MNCIVMDKDIISKKGWRNAQFVRIAKDGIGMKINGMN